MKIIIGYTYGVIEETLNITKEDGFKNIVEKLKQMKCELNCAGILVWFDTLVYLFNQLEIAEGYGGDGNTICSNNYTEFITEVQRNTGTKINTIHEAWIEMQRELCENIQELYRYCLEQSEEAEYLKNILFLLAYTKIIEATEKPQSPSL